MASETEIVNAALRKVGDRRITSIDDTVPSAGVARDVLATERDDLLRSHPWNFAVTRIELSRLAAAPAFEYDYAYAMPSDFMRAVSVHASDAADGDLEYKIEGLKQSDDTYVNAVLCNSTTVFLRYVRRVTDPNLMTPAFRQVLTLRLAVIFTTGIAKSNTLHQILTEELRDATRKAVSVDGIEDYPERMPVGSWASSRHGTRRGF